MGGLVAQHPDQLHPLPDVLPHDAPEVPAVHERRQSVVNGQGEAAVHGVHPFDGGFQAAAAGQDAGGGVDLVDFFRRHRRLGEGGELGVGEEKGEVGHGVTPFVY